MDILLKSLDSEFKKANKSIKSIKLTTNVLYNSIKFLFNSSQMKVML